MVVEPGEVTSSMLTDMVGFVSPEGTVGVGMEEVFMSAASSGGQNLPQLSLSSSGQEVCAPRAIGTEVHLSTDTGASVLLYSCGTCSQTFGTRTELEEHQAHHMGPNEHRGGGEAGHGGDSAMVGVGLVGAGHLLADFEEVVETTTVGENGHTAEELLGLTEGGDGDNVVRDQVMAIVDYEVIINMLYTVGILILILVIAKVHISNLDYINYGNGQKVSYHAMSPIQGSTF